jgi:UDP-N-acetylglucosamine acyltransferase
VGDDNYLMVGVHAGHNVRIGHRTIIANNVLLAGYVEVFDGAVLGGGTAFHQFMRIGRLAMVRGGTRMGKDIPPFTVADDRRVIGLNSIGLRRAGLSPAARLEVKRAFAHIFRSGLNLSQALATIQPAEWGPEATEFFDFIRQAKRGISNWGSSRAEFTEE